MVEFTINNKWKYSTIGLLAVLAVGFSFPQAFAAPIDGVLGVVKDIQAKINDTTFGLPAIQSQLDEVQANTGVVKAVKGQVNFGDVAGGDCEQVLVVNEGSGKVISGRVGISQLGGVERAGVLVVYAGAAITIGEVGEQADPPVSSGLFEFIGEDGRLFLHACDLGSDDPIIYKLGYTAMYTVTENVSTELP